MSLVWRIILEKLPMIAVIWPIKIEISFHLKWYSDFYSFLQSSRLHAIKIFPQKFQVETMRTSANEIVKILFLNPLSKTGNLTVAYNHQMPAKKDATQRSKWGAALVAEKEKAKLNVNV